MMDHQRWKSSNGRVESSESKFTNIWKRGGKGKGEGKESEGENAAARVRAPKENRWPEHSRHRRPCQLASGAIRHNFSFHTFLFRPATHHSLVPNISPPSIVSTTMTEVAELKKPSTIGAAPASALPAPAASASLVPDPKPPAAGGMCYWPDQSCDSLPPLPGKVAAGLVGGRGMEFSVNEECEFWDIFIVVSVFFCFCAHF